MLHDFRPTSSIGNRLSMGFGALLLLLAVVAGYGGVSTQRLGLEVHQVVDVNNRRTALAFGMLGSMSAMAIRARSIALLNDPKEIMAEFKLFEAAKASYARQESSLKEAMADAGPHDRMLVQEIAAAAATTLPLITLAAQQGQEGSNLDATTTLGMQVRPAETIWRARIESLIERQSRSNAQAAAVAQASTRQTSVFESMLVAAAIFVGVIVGWRITRSVSRPIERVVDVAERIADGHLGNVLELGGNDEIGRLLRAIAAMQERLRGLVGEILQTSESIQSASTEVATGNHDLSHRTELTAGNLQRTASAMEQLTETVRQSANAATQADRFAASAAEVAQRGGQVVSQVISTMDAINESSKKIRDIIGVIDGIAFQTNILALNAAVEAARAGEQGRGFAVVAGEVRSLAQRSAEAAREIKTLIGNSVDRVETGSRLVTDAGSTMNEIVSSVQRVTAIIGQIASAAGEQSSGLGQINSAVAQLDEMTQQNAALVEQSAAAAESLHEQASRLTDLLSTFNLSEATGAVAA